MADCSLFETEGGENQRETTTFGVFGLLKPKKDHKGACSLVKAQTIQINHVLFILKEFHEMH